jgi:hypothetical protein
MGLYRWINQRHGDKFVAGLENSLGKIASGEQKTQRLGTVEEMEARWEAEHLRFEAQPRLVKTARRMRIWLFGWEGLLSVKLRPRYLINHAVWYHQRATRGWADCDTWSIDGYLTRILPPMLTYLADHGHSYPSLPPFETPEEWSEHLRGLATRIGGWDRWDVDKDDEARAAMAEYASRFGWYWDLGNTRPGNERSPAHEIQGNDMAWHPGAVGCSLVCGAKNREGRPPAGLAAGEAGLRR